LTIKNADVTIKTGDFIISFGNLIIENGDSITKNLIRGNTALNIEFQSVAKQSKMRRMVCPTDFW
jgi:hypothetical protein